MAAVPVEALDAIRGRLSQLTHSIANLLQELHNSDPLPPWPTLTTQLAILNSQLTSVSSAIASHSDSLSGAVAYPLPLFPVHTQENLLNLLLRKKLAPEIEEWVTVGHRKGLSLNLEEGSSKRTGGGLANHPFRSDKLNEGSQGFKHGNNGKDEREEDGDGEEEEDDDDDDDDDMEADDADEDIHGQGSQKVGNKKMHWAVKCISREQQSRNWDVDFTAEEVERSRGDFTQIDTALQSSESGRIIRKRAATSSASSENLPLELHDRGTKLSLDSMFRFLSTGARPGASN